MAFQGRPVGLERPTCEIVFRPVPSDSQVHAGVADVQLQDLALDHPVGILGVMIDITEFGFSSFKKMLASKYPNLSVREREVANLVRLGMSNKEVAHQLNIALCTVEYHRAQSAGEAGA